MTRLRSRHRRRHRRRHGCCCCWWITDQATPKPDAVNGHFPRCSIKWIHTHRWENDSNSLKVYIATLLGSGPWLWGLLTGRWADPVLRAGGVGQNVHRWLARSLTLDSTDKRQRGHVHLTTLSFALACSSPPYGEMLFHQLVTRSALRGQVSAPAQKRGLCLLCLQVETVPIQVSVMMTRLHTGAF